MEAKVVLKEMPPKKRILYIWDYYKVWIIVGFFVITSLISSIYRYATAKDCLLQLIMVNGAASISESIFAEDYLVARGLSTEDYELKCSSVELHMKPETYPEDYNSTQAMLARLTSGEIDILSAPSDILEPYLAEGYLMSFKDVFTDSELSKYDEYLVYTLDPLTNEMYPCAFDFTDNAWIDAHGYFRDSCQFGIVYNSSNVEQAKDLFLYILNY